MLTRLAQVFGENQGVHIFWVQTCSLFVFCIGLLSYLLHLPAPSHPPATLQAPPETLPPELQDAEILEGSSDADGFSDAAESSDDGGKGTAEKAKAKEMLKDVTVEKLGTALVVFGLGGLDIWIRSLGEGFGWEGAREASEALRKAQPSKPGKKVEKQEEKEAEERVQALSKMAKFLENKQAGRIV